MAESGWRWWRQRQYARDIRERMATGGGNGGLGWPPMVRSTSTLSLPSADNLLCFEASVVIEARWAAAEPAPPALFGIARARITQRAEEVSRRRTLTESERLQDELNTALLDWEQVPGKPVHARGHCESIRPDMELLAAVEAREEAARRNSILSWQGEQRTRQEEHMRSLLLDPLRATASWFLDNQDKPEHVVVIAQKFQELRNLLAPEKQPDSPGDLVDELLATTDEAIRAHLVSLLRRAFTGYGRGDLGVRLPPPKEHDAHTTDS